MHEETHVNLLSAALGDASVAPCEYSLQVIHTIMLTPAKLTILSPYSTVKEFLILACGLENIGVSAYAGANKYISDDMYSTGRSFYALDKHHMVTAMR